MAERTRVTRATSWRSLAIAGGLAILLLYLAVRGTDWNELGGVLRRAQPLAIGLAVLGYTASYTLRAMRWHVLLSAQASVGRLTVFWATNLGYLGNSFLPARAGEVLRTVMLARRTGLNIGYVVATAVIERVVDAITLVVIALAVLAAIEDLPAWLVGATRAGVLVGAIALGGLLVAPRLAWLVDAIVPRLPLPDRFRARVRDLSQRFLVGLGAIQRPDRALRFGTLTAAIWLVDGFAAIAIARAIGLSLSLPQSLLILAALGLSSAAPSTPGFVGIYQFVAVTVLAPFGYSRPEALAFVILLQGVTYLVVVAWGLPALWYFGIGGERALVPTFLRRGAR